MENSSDVSSSQVNLLQNTTSATGGAGADTTEGEKIDLSPLPLFAIFYVFLLLLCAITTPWRVEARMRVQRQRRDKEKKKIDPEERRKVVIGALRTQKVAGHNGSHAIILDDKDKDQSLPVPMELSGRDCPEFDGQTKESSFCMICLEPYLIGEEVSWSRDLKCRHVFHHECIMEWLMEHDECPCCRAEHLSAEICAQEPENKGGGPDEVSQARSDAGDDGQNEGSMAFIIISGLVSRVRKAKRRYTAVRDGEVRHEPENDVVVGQNDTTGDMGSINGQGSGSDREGGFTFGRAMMRRISSGLYSPIAVQGSRKMHRPGKESNQDESEDSFGGNDYHAEKLVSSSPPDDAEDGMVDIELGGARIVGASGGLGDEASASLSEPAPRMPDSLSLTCTFLAQNR